ncbi:ankyrin repeat domain-containing protein [Turneriella parva]|uniref:Uncharacterized protein n=1 Tax=Turneriella parva (strain ATCC BAA-1111 / DSM 21527 / NCTC 11395 / H) TaxID=869212 RepID=I4B3L1_TURPD|nr:ankyrin repeat domain-containing protein [Turneriella parva]AFM11868.1 hypothetical protein Turpa_1220 [Turneriella parva DSM 21527]
MKEIPVVSSFLVFMLVACASPQKRFEKAVVGNDLSGVESALADGAKPTPYMIGGKSLTALEHAIKHKNREMVARLLKADAPVSNTVSDALTVAIYAGDLEIVKMLVASGKFDPKSDKGTKLVVAIRSGRPEIVEYLIGAGFPVNATPGYAPPLAVAIDKNDTESAKKLLHAGANPNLKDERGATVFCLALAQNRSEIALAMLAAKPDVKTHCGNGSPLYWAEKHKNSELSAKIKSLGGKSEYVPPKAESSKFNHSTAKSEKQRELDRIKATMITSHPRSMRSKMKCQPWAHRWATPAIAARLLRALTATGRTRTAVTSTRAAVKRAAATSAARTGKSAYESCGLNALT